ncbi:MAG TPA: TIR domain-containing protein [Saprospiraceae bacterium]|nr:TIR domain-containing protein [Saprospiraceae bacterium]
MKKVFISYAEQDEEFRSQLNNQLTGFKRSGLIESWHDHKLTPDVEWQTKIVKEIDETDFLILLVSADYLATENIWERELKVALERANDPTDNIKLLPIIIRKCDWQNTPLGQFNAIDISNSVKTDEGYQKIASELKDLLLQNISRNSTKGLALARKLIRENLKSKDMYLDLGNCGLVDLSELLEIWNCTYLEKLDFSTKYDEDGNNISNNTVAENRISSVPEDIGKLTNLKELNLAENPIGDEGVIIISQQLRRLQILDISYTLVTDEGLIQICLNIPKLKFLNLEQNNLTDKGIQYIFNHLNYLDTLNISNNFYINFIINIPSNHITDLREFRANYCNITDNGLKSLKEKRLLEILHINGNQITSNGIKHIVRLNNLKELLLHNNLLGDIGVQLISTYFRRLTKLNLSKNELSDEGVTKFTKELLELRHLDLSENSITENGVIEFAKYFKNLIYLDLSDNKIDNDGAKAIGENLKDLEYLNLMTNTLSDEGVKNTVLNLRNLKYANFSDNYMNQIPNSILDNIEALRNWFESKKVPNNTIKMILLGNTRAGKSELAHILKENQNKSDDKTTHGMEHWLWEEKISQDQTLRINIYDFGGQDYYHATHHLFFTHNTLYVVLWNNNLLDSQNKEEGQHFDPGFWLGNIKYLLQDKFEQSQINDSTSIWLVQNKGDLFEINPKSYPDSYLCHTYKVDPNGIFYLSLLKFKEQKSGWKSEWSYFRRHLLQKLLKLAGDIEITEMWATIKDEVLPSFQNRGYFIVDHKYFFDECNDFLGVKKGTADDYKSALIYLNGCGEIILFNEIESLKDKVILDPKRLMKIMYSILTIQAANNEGIIEISNANQIQKKEDINSDMYFWIIEILEFYNIIFSHPIHTDKYVAPQYLNESPYQGILNDLIPASITIKYNDFIPMAIMGKFISHYLKDDTDAKYWKYGAIFYFGNCYCMVRMDRDAKKVYIHVDERKTEPANSSSTKSTLQSKEQKNNLLREFLEFFSVQSNSRIDKSPNQKGIQEQGRIYIQGLELSTNDLDFFSIELMMKDLDHCHGYLPNSAGGYQQVPSIFYFLLNKQSKAPKTIFICYSHADVLHRDELDKHLAALKKQGKVDTFHDGKILPGQKWDEVIKSNLYKSDIVLLLLSVDFMNSIYIWETELTMAKTDKKLIIPIFLRHCDFDGTGIDILQGAPFSNDKPDPKGITWILSSNFKSIDEAYLKVVNRIKMAL